MIPFVGAMLAIGTVAQASTVTWTNMTGTASTNTEQYTTGANWSTGTAPGAADTAYFNGAFTYGSGSSISSYGINFSGTQALGSVIFNNISTTTNIAFGSSGTLLLTNGGSIQDYATPSQFFNGMLLIAPPSATTSGSYTFLSNGGKLRIFGGIGGGTTSGSITLNLTGTSTAASEVTKIVDGAAAGGVSLVKSGAGTWYITGSNSYTGSTTVNGGVLVISGTIGSSANTIVNSGTLQLDWSQTNTVNSAKPATNLINSASTLVFGGNSSVVLNGTAGGTNSQTFNGTKLNSGALATINVKPGTGGNAVLNLGAITRSAGTILDFSSLTSGTITTTTANTGGILGGWAIVGGTGWATSAGDGTNPGAITALSSYTNDTWAVGNNTVVTTSTTLATSATTNSILFSSTGTTITLATTGTSVITSGGILKSGNLGGSSGGIIQQGYITSGNGKDLIASDYSISGLSIYSAIVDNGSTSIGLTINTMAANNQEGGFVIINGANKYTGATYIERGGLKTLAKNTLPTYTTVAFGSALSSGSINTLALYGNSQTIGALGTTAQTTSSTGGAVAVYNGAAAPTSATLTICGKTYVNGSLVNTDSSFAGVIADTISGTASVANGLSITKTGDGSTFSLLGANTYSGTTSVQGGVLAFNSVASGTAAQALGSGNLVNIGLAATSSGTLQYLGAAGTLDKNIYALGNGLNTVKNSGSGLLTLSGSLVKNGTVLVLDGGSSGINVTGTISGSNANSDLYITNGTTLLSSQNTYNGPTWVYGGGILVNGVTNALPTGTTLVLGGTDNSAGTYDLNGNNQTVAGLTGTGSGSKTVTNNGAATSTLTVSGGGNYSGVIANGSGTTTLAVTGGNLILGGINTYTGATSVTGGTLSVNGSLGNSAVSISSPATLGGSGTINGEVINSGTINGSLIFNNNVTVNSGATASAAAFNGNLDNNGTVTSSVAIQSGKVLSGSGSVTGDVTVTSGTINGSGLTLSGSTMLYGASSLHGINNAAAVVVKTGSTNLTGTTTATSLSVSANATMENSGIVNSSVAVNGLLNGSGIINGSLSLSGTLAPGSGVGTATINGNLNMEASATLALEVTGGATGEFDKIVVNSGAIALAGTLDLETLSGLTLNVPITLIENTSNAATSGYFSAIVTSSGTIAVTGSSSTYLFDANGTQYQLNYAASVGGDNVYNDVTLTVVPEPSTWAMIMGGIGLLGMCQRMRRR